MKTYLFFDTETTGIPNYKLPVEHPQQPHIVQLAAQLVTDTGRVLATMDLIIKPDMDNRFTIPAEVAAIHGISQEVSEQYGVDISQALNLFNELYIKCDVLVAHNISFDLRMLRRYAYTANVNLPSRLNNYDLKPTYCTKDGSTDICKLPLTDKQKAAQARNPDWTPPGGWPKYKAPHLYEVYQHFFNRDIDGAHNAIVDVEACRDVFFELKKLETKV